MQAMKSLINQSQLSLQDLQNGHHHQIATSQMPPQFDPSSSSHHDEDFLDQMLSSLPSSTWPDVNAAAAKSPWDISSNTLPSSDDDHFNFDHDQSSMLASKLRHHQISGGGPKSLLLQQQQRMMLQARGFGGDLVDPSSFNPGGEALFNGFAGSLNSNQSQFQQQTQSQNFVAAAPAMNQGAAASGSAGGGASGQTRQRVRARRGQATDPHSIAERLRRERISERMKALQELVPNGNKTDKASMLDEIIDYVKFLQLQVKVLSMSRLGGAAPANPLAPEGGVNRGGVSSNNGIDNEGGTTVTENQVAKMLEDDMGSAMQYLQGKGLCLMPISLATAISTATTNSRNPMMSSLLAASGRGADSGNGGGGGGGDGGGPSSPNMSVLTVQSGNMGNAVGDGSA